MVSAEKSAPYYATASMTSLTPDGMLKENAGGKAYTTMKKEKNTYWRTTHEKRFAQVFLSLTRNQWSAWCDFVELFALSLAKATEGDPKVRLRHEARYAAIAKGYTEPELAKIKTLCDITVEVLEGNPQQDFLGELYMGLDFGSSRHGQFFTPWDISYLMACITMGKSTIPESGYLSVCDPACGAGGMLIAAAAAYQNGGPAPRNYQTDILFAAQDVDRVAAMMCYIQLSLLGCAGYVIVGDSLRDPPCGNALFPIIGEHNEIWYTPMWNSPLWIARRIRHLPIWDQS